MSTYILSILSIAIVGVLADILLENSRLTKFVRGIFGIIILLVIVSPIPSLINGNLDFGFDFDFDAEITLDDNYLQIIDNQKIKTTQTAVEKYLSDNGIKNASVTISGKYSDNTLSVNYVKVDVANAVLDDNLQGANKYELVYSYTAECLNISKSYVLITG